MVVYADASAIVKRYVDEEHHAAVKALVRESAVLATSMVSRAEVSAALARIGRERLHGDPGVLAAEQQFSEEWTSYARLPVTESVVARAGWLAWTHGLRGHDAIHLASALAWRDASGRETVLATFDRTLRAAAESAGLRVWPEPSPDAAMP